MSPKSAESGADRYQDKHVDTSSRDDDLCVGINRRSSSRGVKAAKMHDDVQASLA
jgi:hypothetical protein